MSGIDQLPMPTTYVKLMLQASNAPEKLLANTGLAVEDVLAGDGPIPVWQQLQCVRNSAAMMRRSGWHLEWVKKTGERFHGPLTAALSVAPTVGEALDAMVRYLPTRIPYLYWQVVEQSPNWICEIRPLTDLGDIEALLIEVAALSMLANIRGARMGKLEGLVVRFPHPPLTAQARYEQLFGCAFEFSCSHTSLSLPNSWRDDQNPAFDASLYASAIARCEDTLSANADGTFGARIASELHQSFEHGWGRRTPPTLEDMADHLFMSVRTLNRRLKQANITYTSLVDDVRKQRAIDLLNTTDRSIGQIAGMLGYDDPASFTRAFGRWYGQPPGRYRRGKRLGQPAEFNTAEYWE